MCDTLVALPGATAGGATLFAKNSDRERNEAQVVEMHAASDHAHGEIVALTYISIPQARRTHACLLSRPFWMWGAEMGANEHGVIIGNEAVHAVVSAQRRRALTGMDLVRLGLERAASAAEAADVITALLERHGQGGDCGHLGRFYYHNSFLIADRAEAYVLETVGRWWALERVRETRAISNALSIGTKAERISSGLAGHADANGWRDIEGRFDFADRLMDRARDAVTRGTERCARSTRLLDAKAGVLTAADMRAALRDHGDAGPDWTPEGIVGRTLCMHAGSADRRSQTTGALVSELRAEGAIHWVTATSTPCLSLFKPVVLGSALPAHGPAPSDRFDPAALWWRHEILHRWVLGDYPKRAPPIIADRDRLEAGFAARVDAAATAGPKPLREAIESCWRDADIALDRWLASARAAPRAPVSLSAYARSWRRLNAVAGC